MCPEGRVSRAVPTALAQTKAPLPILISTSFLPSLLLFASICKELQRGDAHAVSKTQDEDLIDDRQRSMTKIPSVRIARQFRAQCPFFLQRWHSESFSAFFLPLTGACPLTSLVFFFFFGGAGPFLF